MSIVGLHFFYVPCFVSEYKTFPSSQGAGLQKIMLRMFFLHILCAMLVHRNKNSVKVGNLKSWLLLINFQ